MPIRILSTPRIFGRAAAGLRVPFVLALLTFAIPANIFGVSAVSAGGSVTSHFVWTATVSNIFGDATVINNAATNSQPGPLLFVTPNYDAGGVGPGTYDEHAVLVWYTGLGWAIFNEDKSAMVPGESFNVLVVPKTSSSVFVHFATKTTGSSTLFSSTLTNGKPKALIQVTQVFNPGTASGIYNSHPVGVWYDAPKKKWAILNEDKSVMTPKAGFNVIVGTSKSGGGTAAVQKATTSNAGWGDSTFISNSKTNSHPNAVVFETPDVNPDGKGGTYDGVATGVWYNYHGVGAGQNKWAVFNEDKSAVPLKAAFNVLMFSN